MVFNTGVRARSLKSCLTAGYRSGGNFIPASGETSGPSNSPCDQILSLLHIFNPLDVWRIGWGLNSVEMRRQRSPFVVTAAGLIHCVSLFIHKSLLYEVSLCEFHYLERRSRRTYICCTHTMLCYLNLNSQTLRLMSLVPCL